MSRLKELIHEIHRRSLWQVLGIYLVGSWIAYEVIQSLTEGLGLPAWFPALAIVLFIVLLPVVLATAFVQEGMGRGASHAHRPIEIETTAGGTPVEPVDRPEVKAGSRILTWRNAIIAGVIGFALWGVVAAAWLGFRGRPENSTPVAVEAATLDPNLVAVLPFRVSGADPEVAFLREGMVDVLAQTLTGEGGPRAVDPRTALSAWRRAAESDDEELSDAASMKVARSLGAGLVLLGGVVGTPDNLILSASVIQSSGGADRARGTVHGPADSLTALVNALTAQLLLQQAVGDAPASPLANTTLPVIRAYAAGQVAYRQGHYEAAAAAFERALTLDSTFVPAAVGLRMAGNWFGAAQQRQIALAERLAWAGRDRLSPADRAILQALLGANYPALSPPGAWLEVLDEAAQTAPDRPEVWYELGDWYYHEAPLVGIRDHFQRARAAFSRAVSLDSSFAAALEHLMDVSAVEGDSTVLRAVSRHYFALRPDTDVSDYYRWRVAIALGDTASLETLRGRYPEMSNPSLWRIAGYAQMLGVGMDDAARAVDELRGRSASPAELATNAFVLGIYALNTGRPALHNEIWNEARLGGDMSGVGWVPIPFSPYWDADPAVAAAEVERLAGSIGVDETAEAAPTGSLQLCLLGLWHLNRDDLVEARETVALLGPMQADTDPVESSGAAACTRALDPLVQLREGRISPRAAITGLEAGLDEMNADESELWVVAPVFTLELSRLYEQAGEYQKALSTVRRRRFGWARDAAYLSSLLREEGRLAAVAGDRDGAIRAYRHYLALRSDPEPVLAAEVAAIRAELNRLEAEGE